MPHKTKILAKAAKIVRQDILAHNFEPYTGDFSKDCQEKAIPSTLLSLCSMILYGNLKNLEKTLQALMTICQLFPFSLKKKKSDSVSSRHTLAREPPVAVYATKKLDEERECC